MGIAQIRFNSHSAPRATALDALTSRLMPDQKDLDGAWQDWIRTGDDSKLGVVFDVFYQQLVSFAYRIVQNRDTAEDVVQNLFATLLERGSSVRDGTSVRNYLYVATRNEARSYLKRDTSQRNTPLDNAINLPITDDEADAAEELASTYLDIQRAINRLPDRTRLVFALSREHNKSYGEIAAMLGITVSTVNSQISRALELIRSDLRRQENN